MQVIGITGSSGSGKTTISKILAQKQDAKLINADQMAKEMTNTETEYLFEIRKAFENENILLNNGTLNRSKLADLIYHNQSDLEKLNQITFRYLVPQIIKEIKQASLQKKMAILDAPLLFEAGLNQYCDYTIAVQAPLEVKIARICERDKISKEIAQSRLKIQKTDDFYLQHADYIIRNHETTTLEDLENQLKVIFNSTV